MINIASALVGRRFDQRRWRPGTARCTGRPAALPSHRVNPI